MNHDLKRNKSKSYIFDLDYPGLLQEFENGSWVDDIADYLPVS